LIAVIGAAFSLLLLSGSSRLPAFHMSELLLAQRFVLGFFLTKIGASRSGGSLFRPRRLTSAAKAGTQEAHQCHSY
jgi:hypothetical protein